MTEKAYKEARGNIQQRMNTYKQANTTLAQRKRDNATNLKAYLTELKTGISKGSDLYLKIVHAEQRVDMAMAQAYDPYFGMGGRMSHYFRGMQAAVDGAGGFELENHETSQMVVPQLVNRFKVKMWAGVDIGKDVLNGLSTFGLNQVSNKSANNKPLQDRNFWLNQFFQSAAAGTLSAVAYEKYKSEGDYVEENGQRQKYRLMADDYFEDPNKLTPWKIPEVN